VLCVMFALDVKEEVELTLLVDSVVPLNCRPLVLLKCVIIVRRGPRPSPTGRRFRNVERRVVTKQNLLRLPPRTLQPVHHVYFAGNPRNPEKSPSAHQNVSTSLTPGLLSSLKFSRSCHFQESRRIFYVRMADINKLPYYQKGLYGDGEAKL